ncbi:MAG: hypothetical protein ACXVEF_23045 [Polyangiales bacterium]
MRGVIRGVVFFALGPALLAVAASFVSLDASSAPNALDAISKDALPSPDAALPPKDALPLDAKPGDAAPKKPDALPPPNDAGKPIPPDPTPLAADAIYVMSVRWNKATHTIDKGRREKLPKSDSLPRHLGRFAAELYSGPDLVERLRFDFPLIEDDTALGDTYAKGLNVTVEVKIPDSVRPNKLQIWDRATDRRWTFPYPPVAP